MSIDRRDPLAVAKEQAVQFFVPGVEQNLGGVFQAKSARDWIANTVVRGVMDELPKEDDIKRRISDNLSNPGVPADKRGERLSEEELRVVEVVSKEMENTLVDNVEVIKDLREMMNSIMRSLNIARSAFMIMNDRKELNLPHLKQVSEHVEFLRRALSPLFMDAPYIVDPVSSTLEGNEMYPHVFLPAAMHLVEVGVRGRVAKTTEGLQVINRMKDPNGQDISPKTETQFKLHLAAIYMKIEDIAFYLKVVKAPHLKLILDAARSALENMYQDLKTERKEFHKERRKYAEARKNIGWTGIFRNALEDPDPDGVHTEKIAEDMAWVRTRMKVLK